MKPITAYLICSIIISAFIGCTPNIQSQTDRAIQIAKSKFPNMEVADIQDFELVRKLEIKHPDATIQLLKPTITPTTQSDGEGQIIVLSNIKNQYYAIPLPPTRHKSYWNFVYDTAPSFKPVKNKTFETELNKALDTLGLNTGHDGLNVLTELFISVLQARQIGKRDTLALKPIDIQPHIYPDSCIEMSNKTYESLVTPMRKEKYWLKYLYIDDNGRTFLIDFSFSEKEKKKYYHFKIFRQPCVLDVKPIYL